VTKQALSISDISITTKP